MVNIFKFLTSFSIFSIIVIVFSVSAHAANIDVAVDRNPVLINDSFQLTFTASEELDNAPDFKPLERDFDVINQQKSSQMSWINGKSSKSIQWILTVMAKQTGELRIPVISFGDDASKSLTITIKNTAENNVTNLTQNELFLEVKATPQQSYIQSQILYTVRFYQRVNIAQATLTDPDVDNAVIEKLGEDTAFNTKIKGVNYHVTERKYAIFPQQSGSITIPPVVLTAQVLIDDPRDRFNSLFSTQSTQTKRVLSKAIKLDILAKPTTFSGTNWLPAKQLQLQQAWSDDALEVKVGEPITRTLALIVTGSTASQLPDFLIQDTNPQLKIYPDKAVTTEQNSGSGLIATKQQKIAFIPTSEGRFELPAIEISWFNTVTNKIELAQLPATQLVAIKPPVLDTSNNSSQIIANTSNNTPPVLTAVSASQSHSHIWVWTTWGFGLGWLITVFVVIWLRIKKAKQKTMMPVKDPKLSEIRSQLELACKENKSAEAYQAIRLWGLLIFGSKNIDEISVHCEPRLQIEISLLSQCIYSQKVLDWHGKAFWLAFTDNNSESLTPRQDCDPLLTLNRI